MCEGATTFVRIWFAAGHIMNLTFVNCYNLLLFDCAPTTLFLCPKVSGSVDRLRVGLYFPICLFDPTRQNPSSLVWPWLLRKWFFKVILTTTEAWSHVGLKYLVRMLPIKVWQEGRIYFCTLSVIWISRAWQNALI